MNEVMELVKVVSDATITNTLSTIVLSAETCGLDTESKFFQELPSMLDNLTSPLDSIGTVYQQ